MRWVALGLLFAFGLGAQPGSVAESLLERVKERMRENLERMPDYVCTQTIERAVRSTPKAPLQALDTLRLEVALVGNRELFSWVGADRFQEQELASLVGRGTVGTGSFALHVKTVFLTGAATFQFQGTEQRDGRTAARFSYSVPQEASRYRLRMQPREAVVPFRGAFVADVETYDLLQLDVEAVDIPEMLGVARANETMRYARTPIGQTDFLLPKASELLLTGSSGEESLNRASFGACRQYGAVSRMLYDASPSIHAAAVPSMSPGVLLDVELETRITLSSANIGDVVTARLARPAGALPQGSALTGRIVRLDRATLPFDHFVVGLRLEHIETPAGLQPVAATMEDVSAAAGLINQAKRFNPTFDRKRKPRMEILVREQQSGEGVLHWEARKPAIPAGLRMRWRTEAP